MAAFVFSEKNQTEMFKFFLHMRPPAPAAESIWNSFVLATRSSGFDMVIIFFLVENCFYDLSHRNDTKLTRFFFRAARGNKLARAYLKNKTEKQHVN